MPKENTVHSYVVHEEGRPDEITDFFSFYQLPTQCLGKETDLNIMYSYYGAYRANSVQAVTAHALKYAKQLGADVFNMLDIMQNEQAFEELKFGRGDGYLHYYFYNYRIDKLELKDVAMILV